MAEIGQPYASGNWLVQAGREDDFVERWTTFTQWSLDNAPGTESFTLLRDTAQPRRFLSIGTFESQEAVTQWRERPEFTELRDACREVCELFEPHDYTVAASPGSYRIGTEQVAGSVQEGVTTTAQTASGLLGAATGAVSGVTGSAVEATASGAERAAEAVVFPIEGYDEMNVDEISGRLEDLSVEELQLVRDYEELNEKRKTLLEQMDRKIRAAS